jgi:ceramide glucosyltransferase
MSLELALAILAVALVLEAWRGHLVLARSLGPAGQAPGLDRYPSVTLIRPIKGIDPGLEENVLAGLHHGYPGTVETLFVFDEESEPAVATVKRALAAWRPSKTDDTARILYCGPPPDGRTGKLNAMIAAYAQSRGELVAFADSDIRPDRTALKALVETLLSARDSGSAFAPVKVSDPPLTVGDVGYALLINGLYGHAAAAAATRHGGELPFIMGQFMIFRRRALAAIGGLESAEGQLVDDMYIGARVKAAGFRNLVCSRSVPIIQHGMSLGDFYRTYVRWLAFSRTGLPGMAFKLSSWVRGAVFWVGLLLALGCTLLAYWVPALLALLAPLSITASINRLHRALGGARLSARRQWVGWAVLAMAPAVLLTVLFRREVTWRGRAYRLSASSHLDPERALPVDTCPACRRRGVLRESCGCRAEPELLHQRR